MKYELEGIEWSEVDSVAKVERGDHISYREAWYTPVVKHAIVEGVNVEKNVISIIRWSIIAPT